MRPRAEQMNGTVHIPYVIEIHNWSVRNTAEIPIACHKAGTLRVCSSTLRRHCIAFAYLPTPSLGLINLCRRLVLVHLGMPHPEHRQYL